MSAPVRGALLIGVSLAIAFALTLTATPQTAEARRGSPTPTPTPTATPTPTPTPTGEPLTITTTTLNHGNVGAAYNEFIISSGGQGSPDTFRVIAGVLPNGLSMASDFGVASTLISGTPTTVQTRTFTVEVRDPAGNVDTQVLSITVPGQSLQERGRAPLHLVDRLGQPASRAAAEREHHLRDAHDARHVRVHGPIDRWLGAAGDEGLHDHGELARGSDGGDHESGDHEIAERGVELGGL